MSPEEIEAIAQRPTYCKTDGEAVTLSRIERDKLVALACIGLQQSDELPEIDIDDTQDWSKTSPAVAWHLIFRHGENWTHTGVLMERWARAWVKANPEKEDDRS